ncbi:hypothetical protein AHAS_Ahas03G0225700 [Arachis hypogaea]
MGVARPELGVARWYSFPESNARSHKRSVARQLSTITWACHLKTQAWHSNAREGQVKLGMPLDVESVACQLPTITWVCHLSIQAWHSNARKGQEKPGVPLEIEGVACQALIFI